MNKKMLISTLFVLSFTLTTLAQVNKELSKSSPLLIQKDNAVKTNKYSTKILTLAISTISYHPLFNAPLLNTNIGPAQYSWISEIQHSEIQLNNIMIRTDHYYGINNSLISSSLNIKLSKYVSYRIFP